eukprot:1374685-Pyramimonas_sp.AAC.1
MLLYSHCSSLGAAPDASAVVSSNLFSAPRLDKETSLDDPSKVGVQPGPRVRPGAGPRRGTGSFGVGALAP